MAKERSCKIFFFRNWQTKWKWHDEPPESCPARLRGRFFARAMRSTVFSASACWKGEASVSRFSPGSFSYQNASVLWKKTKCFREHEMLLPRKFGKSFLQRKTLKNPVFFTVRWAQVMKQRGMGKGRTQSGWKRQNRARDSEHEILSYLSLIPSVCEICHLVPGFIKRKKGRDEQMSRPLAELLPLFGIKVLLALRK